jgi:hypothetical protein
VTTATKANRATKLDRLLEQGEWVALPMDGNNPPCRFVMPTEELQSELEKELEKRSGSICATAASSVSAQHAGSIRFIASYYGSVSTPWRQGSILGSTVKKA